MFMGEVILQHADIV